MWQNFTERGKRVFQLAHSEALRLGHEVIGTEHILLGLLDDADGIVTQILSNYNLHPEVLKAEIESLRDGQAEKPACRPSFKSESQACDRSFHEEARKMGVNYIGPNTYSGHTCRRGRDGRTASGIPWHGSAQNEDDGQEHTERESGRSRT